MEEEHGPYTDMDAAADTHAMFSASAPTVFSS
jgi:hypothetical protein